MNIQKLFETIRDSRPRILESFDPTKEEELISSIKNLTDFLLFVEYTNNTNRVDEYMENTISVLLDVTSILYNNYGYQAIPDSMYDSLETIMENINQLKVSIGAPVNTNDKVAYHSYPSLRGSLRKVYSMRKNQVTTTGLNKAKNSVEDWISYVENKLGRELSFSEKKVILQPKIDGVSIEFEMDRYGRMYKALTRGNVYTNEAKDVTHIFGKMDFKDLGCEYGLKTEVYVTYSDFEILEKKFGFSTPLSAVSGIVNSNTLIDKDILQYVHICPLRRQLENSTDVEVIYDKSYAEAHLDNLDDLEKKIYALRELEKDIPMDGIVIILQDNKLREELGILDHKAVGEVAFKFPPEESIAILKDVDWQIGLLGNITPVAKIETVKMKGKNISSISLGSRERFHTLDLHKGDKVSIKYDVIPYLDKVDQTHVGEKFEEPKYCPSCLSELNESLRCVNRNCPNKTHGRILNYIISVAIDGFGPSILETLIEKKYVTSIPDIYRLERYANDIKELPRFGIVSTYNLLVAIKDKKSLSASKMLGALGFVGLGERTFKLILDEFSLEELFDICKKGEVYRLTQLKGIGDKTAESIISSIDKDMDLIKELMKYVDIIDEEIEDESSYHTKVYMTKIRDEEFSKFLKSKGILHTDKFNKSVDYLIIKDKDSDSKKIGKYDIPVLTLDEAYKKFGYKQD